MADSRAEFIIKQQEFLDAERGTWNTRWQNMANLVRPMRSEFNLKRAEGDSSKTQYIYDSTALLAQDNLASGLWSQITNAATSWFMLRHPDDGINDKRENKLWLDRATKTMQFAFSSRGNRFYSQALELYRDCPTFGTAVMYSELRDDRASLHFRSVPLDQAFIDANKWGEVDRVYRRFKMTNRQALQAFGEEAFPVNSTVRKQQETLPFAKHDYIHAVMPIDDIDVNQVQRVAGKAFASFWVSVMDRSIVREGGYFEMPYQVPRWNEASRGVYGDSQADLAMPDVRMVNTMAKTTLSAAELRVKPPLLAPNESVMRGANRRGLRTGPQAIMYGAVDSQGRQLVHPLQAGGDVGLGLEMEEQRRNAIREAFFFSLLQMVASPSATATEILAKEEEKLRLMGPQLGRLQNEFLDPLIDRVFALLLRAGAFGDEDDIPEDLRGVDLQVRYVSPLARAQRVQEAGAADRLVMSVGNMAQASGDVSVWDNIDRDEMVRVYQEAYGAPESVMVPEEERDADRQRQQQAAMMSQMAAQAQDVTGALKDVSEIRDAGSA